jgi:hypothetical protein
MGFAMTRGAGIMALASGFAGLLVGRVVGWFGRGVRGPLRDAIVAESVSQETRGQVLTAELVDAQARSTGFGILGTVNGVGKLVSSTTVGVVWSAVSPTAAFAVAAALMGLGTAALLAVNGQGSARRRPPARGAAAG